MQAILQFNKSSGVLMQRLSVAVQRGNAYSSTAVLSLGFNDIFVLYYLDVRTEFHVIDFKCCWKLDNKHAL